MTKFMNKVSYLIMSVAVVSMALLSSCSSSDDVSDTTAQSSTPVTLTLTIQPKEAAGITGKSGVSSRATNITTDPVGSENTVGNLTVGIFDAAGNVRIIRDFTSSDLMVGSDYVQARFKTSQVKTTDQILVAANAPAKTFAGVQTVADFKAKKLSIGVALTGSETGTEETTTNIPMFGAINGGVTVNTADNTVSATVPIIHLVAKVSLVSLTTAFDPAGANSAATFTPTEMFLHIVTGSLKFDNTNPFVPGPGAYYHHGWAEAPDDFPDLSLSKGGYREYLSTGALAAKELKGTSGNWGTQYFYTMPNHSYNGTRLIIAGWFKANATTDAVMTYYPVRINYNSVDGSAAEGTTANLTHANYNYKMTVVIKGKGLDTPSGNLDTQTATITATVTPFVDVDQIDVIE